MFNIRLLSIILFAMFFALNVSAQRKVRKPIGYGASAIYNFQAEGIGADLRVRIPTPINNLYVVPEISYYPHLIAIMSYMPVGLCNMMF